MAINRAQLVKELVPGLHALFGLEYDRYAAEYERLRHRKFRKSF